MDSKPITVVVYEPTGKIVATVSSVAEAEVWIEARAENDPQGVYAGNYGIDSPCYL